MTEQPLIDSGRERCGALTLAVSMGFFVLNVAKILSHLFFPVLKPFPSRAAN
ncbi:MAG TPA: hypothetical protein VFD66_03160 [Verrucomicrobiae bacterium]|nr:hypothetical protein [Verrucomicrobiae bacterium]